ncbi:MAG: ferritin-like domain-containing protein [Deltaproteobacteria bacterium]|nr:ferritin-like domain-containing protein [Deltaproteobacteria bacterium]
MLETPQDVLNEYEKRPRALTPAFVAALPWGEIRKHPLDGRFFPILRYMRDIERFTEVYFEELRRTPTGKEPAIRRFMERWNQEEAQHGDLLQRFLAEAGCPDEPDWPTRARAAIPLRYRVESRLTTSLTRLFGKHFSPTHMVWGAINELSTLQGYRRLIELAGHPVLTGLLRGILQEESIHVFFYFNIARLQLERSRFDQRLARFVIRHYWAPVGTGIKPAQDTELVVQTLFGDEAGRKAMEDHVTARLENLPGFTGVKTVTDKINKYIQLVNIGNADVLPS